MKTYGPLFFSLGILLTAPEIPAQNKCTHLGGDVICPAGVSPGSNSLFFTPTGIRWSDGSETSGFNVPAFPSAPPESPLPELETPSSPTSPNPSPSSPPETVETDPGSINTDLDNDPVSDLVFDVGEQVEQTRKDEPSLPPPPVPLLTTEEYEELQRLLAPFEEEPSGTRKGYLPQNKNLAEIRKSLISIYQGTGDLAAAAEDLLKYGGGLQYDQTNVAKLSAGEQKQYVGASAGNDLLGATKGNCYEFVHFVAWLAGSGTDKLHNVGGGTASLLDVSTMQKWDGKSPIPRGWIIVGAVGYDKNSVKTIVGGTPQDRFGFIHVGISLGNGKVASNRNEGASIETVKKVFGDYRGLFSGGEVYIGPYDGYSLPSTSAEFIEAQTLSATAKSQIDIGSEDDQDFSDDSTPEERAEDRKYRQELKKSATEQLAVIQAFQSGVPIANPTEEQKQFKRFFEEGILSAGSKPYYLDDFEKWKAANQTAQTLAGKDATAVPPAWYDPNTIKFGAPLGSGNPLSSNILEMDTRRLASIAPVTAN